MKLVMILNQIQAGVGTKDDHNVPLTATKDIIGPGSTLKPILAKADQQLLVTFYLGDGTYEADKNEVKRKVKGMLERLQIEGVICGPSFDYKAFSAMSAELAKDIQDNTDIKVICAMSEENSETIAAYKESIDIVKMPKKGAGGLKEAYKAMAKVLEAKSKNKARESYQDKIY